VIKLSKEVFQIPSLDGMRAVAISFVVLSHLHFDFFPGQTVALAVSLVSLGNLHLYFLQGEFGVTLFFFLSGYLITTLLRVEYDRRGTIRLRDFYLRRVLRIFPPFYVVLLAGVILTAFGGLRGWPLTAEGVLSQALYVNNYYQIANFPFFGATAGTWVFWSLAVEEHFYLLFPLLYLTLRGHIASSERQAALLLIICGLVLLWRSVIVFRFHPNIYRAFLATDTRLDSILFGCILGIVENPALDESRFSERWWKWVWLPLGLGGLVGVNLVGGLRFHQSVSYSLQGICFFPLFVSAVRYPDWLPFRLLNTRLVRFLGVISYSLYLVHESVLIGVRQWVHAPRLVQALLGVMLAILLAVSIHYAVEEPCRQLRRRLSHVRSADAERSRSRSLGRRNLHGVRAGE
jgi:peptidoglycan/LPS O-acetylase OafA/YrhL